jgi:hypothetical protein
MLLYPVNRSGRKNLKKFDARPAKPAAFVVFDA